MLLLKRKMNCLFPLRKLKKNFDKYKLICKGKSPYIAFNKNETFGYPKTYWCFGTTLKKCAFDMNKFSSMFPKGKTQRKYTSHTSHTQHEKLAQHTHTHQYKHAFIYSKVYTCAQCGYKGHLAKFCYAKLHMLNKNIWVRESSNSIGPKKIWVPKNTPNLINIGMSTSSKT